MTQTVGAGKIQRFSPSHKKELRRTMSEARSPSNHTREPCRTKHKPLVVVIFVSLVISCGNETRMLKSVSPDRSTSVALVRRVPELNATPTEAVNTSGTFNNLDVIYRDLNRTLFSTAECIGESFRPDSWMYRSCLYRNLCFDVSTNEFVLFQSPINKRMVSSNPDTHFLSSSFNNTVSLGGFVSAWRNGKSRLKWSPKIVDSSELLTSGYYELVGDTVMIPFHTLAAQNIGHFLWDNLLPIYALQSLFGLSDKKLVLLRYMLDGKQLYLSCEGRFVEGCERNFERLLPMVGVSRSSFSSTQDAVLKLTNGEERKSNYVCSSLGAAGIGHLTDHGLLNHGKRVSDYEHMHNYGRGPTLFDFRNYILKNLNMQHLPDRISSTLPLRISFSVHSSNRDHRNLGFEAQIAALKSLSDPKMLVNAYQFSELSMEQEIEIVAQSAILVTACGGGAASSMFLPRGASLIMFYSGHKERIPNAKLDYDYVNNMGYVRTHWLAKREDSFTDAFVALIQNEIEVISLQEESQSGIRL